MPQLIQINRADNVAITLQALRKGEQASLGERVFTAQGDIPADHKLALSPIACGEKIIKYGMPIGIATADIRPGDHVHSHNMRSGLSGLLGYTYQPCASAPAVATEGLGCTFWGYRRKNGRVGTRNQVWIIPTVNCVNDLVDRLAREASQRFAGLCDGILALPHNGGCSQLGDDFATTQHLLRGLVMHPNAGGVLLVSLGCENNDFDHFLPCLDQADSSRLRTMVAQKVEGNELEYGLKLIQELLDEMRDDRRVEVDASHLVIGMKCGGSDSLSGLTANPLCGDISNVVTAMGGSSILTEVPEMFGAETLLMSRADSRQSFDAIVQLINGFKEYYISHHQPVCENPSPGNKAGGITTLEEKSLGCIQKGGHALITGTLTYGEPCLRPGLNLLTGPGNDSVSVTNLLCSGAQIILFTTGRGNPLGTFVPTLKISSNSDLMKRKPEWIDFDAGEVLSTNDRCAVAAKLWQKVLDVASGRQQAHNETFGYRQIMLFKDGVML